MHFDTKKLVGSGIWGIGSPAIGAGNAKGPDKPLITSGHSATISQLVAGELDATPTAYGYMAERARLAGLPVEFLSPEPVALSLHFAGLLNGAPYPAAARLFLNWLLSMPAQQLIAGTERTAVRTDVRWTGTTSWSGSSERRSGS